MAIELERSITVRRPVAEVVEYLADFAHAEEWDSGTVTCTRIGDGPVATGARWRNVSEFRGRQTTLEYELVRSEPTRLTFVGKNKTVTSTDDLTFQADGSDTGGTVVRYDVRFDFHGLAALGAYFVKGALNTLADDTMAQMKDVLDR